MIMRMVIIMVVWGLLMAPAVSRAVESNETAALNGAEEESGDDGGLGGLDLEATTIEFTRAPDSVEAALEHLSSVLVSGTGALQLAQIGVLASFAQNEADSGRAWKLRTRWGADGAASVSALNQPFNTCIAFSYSTNIPDYGVLPCSLRYSEDTPDSTAAFMRCVASAPASNTLVHSSFLCREETTPNPQSGTAYSYITRRHLIRANLDGTDVLGSFSDMQGRSSYALRGIPVGPPEHDVYYYSERTGTNLRGLQWVKPRMNLSRSLVLWVPAGSNRTAFIACSWVHAGWRQINVTRTHHIYDVLDKILRTRHELAQAPAMTEHATQAAVQRVFAMSSNEVQTAYARYCAYVKHWRDIERSQAGLTSLYQPNSLSDLYNEGELARMPFHLRQALIVQEELRALRGAATWSDDGATTNTPARRGWSRFLRM